MKQQTLSLTVVACLALVASPDAYAGDWPHWLGPNRNDTCEQPSGWSANGWKYSRTVWKQNVGEGSTSPIIADDRVFVTGWRDGRDSVYCLHADTGVEDWSVSYACPQYGRLATGDEALYSGPTSTPEYDAATGFLYTLSCDGDLNCRDTREQGRQVWHVSLHETLTVQQRPKVGRSGLRDYGYTTAPFVRDDWVIVETGAEEGTVTAFDKTSGRLLWHSEARDPAGHTGGLVPITVEGIPCLAAMTFQGLLIIRLDSGHEGETVAHHEWVTDFANNIATPAVHGSSVLITSAYNHTAICRLDITLEGATKVWEQPFPSKVCTPVIHNGHVYFAWQKLHCLDFQTGELQWAGGAFSDAGSCILTSDQRLIVWGGRGTLALVDTADQSPAAYRELARLDKLSTTDVWPHVALADGRLFCKDRKGTLVCIE